MVLCSFEIRSGIRRFSFVEVKNITNLEKNFYIHGLGFLNCVDGLGFSGDFFVLRRKRQLKKIREENREKKWFWI